MFNQQRLLAKQKYLSQLIQSFNGSQSPFFRECITACIEKEIKEIKSMKPKVTFK